MLWKDGATFTLFSERLEGLEILTKQLNIYFEDTFVISLIAPSYDFLIIINEH